MQPLSRIFAKLYPRRWRQRYGEEFDALLDAALPHDALPRNSGASVRAAFDVLAGAIAMQIQCWKKTGAAALLAAAALAAASWWVGQRPYISPGTHLVFRQDSNPGGLLGFFVMVAALAGGLVCLALLAGGKLREARRVGRFSAGTFGLYVAAVALVAMLTPRTIVSIGDGYCYDLWCIGAERVTAAPHGESVLYTVDVRIFSDADHVAAHENNFLYAVDEQGRRFPLRQDSSAPRVEDITVNPGQSVKTSLTLLAPADARNLYLTGERLEVPWVYLYFGSKISPFHRRTLLRIV